MKIKIAYTASEAMLATLIDQVIGNVLTGARRSEFMENKTPHRHIYYQTKLPEELIDAAKPAKGRDKPRHYKQTINGGKNDYGQQGNQSANRGNVPGKGFQQKGKPRGKQQAPQRGQQGQRGPNRH